MIDPDKVGEAEGRSSNDIPLSLEFWLDRAGDGNFAGQEKQRKTELSEHYYSGLVRYKGAGTILCQLLPFH